MKIKNVYTLITVLLIHTYSNAQPYVKYTSPQVFVSGQKLKNAWAGGLNAPIFNTIDLNGDGIKDLFLFDKQFDSYYAGVFKMRTFINHGTAGVPDYEYDPFYEKFFPGNMTAWCILLDYDCDGDEDLFTHNTIASGVNVYTNTPANGHPNFTLTYSPLPSCIIQPGPTCYQTSLFVTAVNQPAFVDVNGDGDLDVLTFQSAANYIEYHENLAEELYGRCDTFVLKQFKSIWAHVGLSPFSNTALLGQRAGHTTSPFNERSSSSLHSGSCMMAYDENGDGDMDIINGDILGNNLLYLHNSATIAGVNDSIDMQDSLFPVAGTPAMYVTFPSPYLFDADNDGMKDLLVSSCTETQSENYHNNLFYKNMGDNTNHNFQFVKERFLTDEMIDVGSGALPVFFDVDLDGKKDLLIGNNGYFIHDSSTGHQESAIAYYRNTSTGVCPRFDFVTDDFSNLQSYMLQGIYPAFADLDGDGDNDMLIGNKAGNLYYFQNTALAGNPAQFTLAVNGINYQNIDVGSNSTPQLVDVDLDGLVDLIIGEQSGKIYYYHNTGTTTSPVFSYVTNNFGGVNVTNTTYTFFGYSIPYLFNDNGTQKLLAGSESGYLFLYDNITGNLTGNFNLVSPAAYGIFEPSRIAPALADLNNDGQFEIITGCFAGGLSFYSKSLPGCTTAINEIPGISPITIYPNPAVDRIVVDNSSIQDRTMLVEFYDIPGKRVLKQNISGNNKNINISSLSNGVYIVKVMDGINNVTQKIIVQRDENK